MAVSIGQILYWVSLTIVAYLFASAIRDLYFHPLSKVPGPFWSKISSIPSFYHSVKGDRHIWLWQNFQIYGHKVRIYPDGVVFNDPQSYLQIYNQKANVRRSNFYKAWQRNHLDINTMNTTDNAVHARKRRILNLVFADRPVQAAGVFINKHVTRWHELLVPVEVGNGWTKPFDFSHSVDFLILDILGELCFGRSFEVKEPGENPLKDVPNNIAEYLSFVCPLARSPAIDFMVWLKPRGLDALMERAAPPAVKLWYQFAHDSVMDRLKMQDDLEKRRAAGEGSSREDIFHFLVTAKDPATGKPALSLEELLCEVHLLIIAGSDTTAVVLSGFFFYITQDDRVYDKLVREIRDKFASAEEVVNSPSKLYECEYLRACINECLRMVPGGPSEMSRTILPGGMEIGGEHLPAGITVGHSLWCTGRNDQYIRDANIYKPERWIVDEKAGNTSEMVAVVRNCAINFSAGPTSCPGKNLATLEMLTIIGRTLYSMDVRRARTSDDDNNRLHSNLGGGNSTMGWGQRDKFQYQVRDAFISIRQGPMLQLKKRAGVK